MCLTHLALWPRHSGMNKEISGFLGKKQINNQDERLNSYNKDVLGFPGGTVVKNLPANAGDTGSSPGLGRSHMPRSN